MKIIVWTLTVDTDAVVTTIHPTEQAAYDALRMNYAEDFTGDDGAMVEELTEHQGVVFYLEDQEIETTPQLVTNDLAVTIEQSIGDDGFPYAESQLTMPDGGTVRVLLYRSQVIEHGISVQIETDDLVSHLAVMLNDGDIYEGSPEIEMPSPASEAGVTPVQSEVRVTFSPEAWQNDHAVPVDPEGPTEWLVSAVTATMIRAACVLNSGLKTLADLDFVRHDEFTPEWIKQWHGPFTIHAPELEEEN